MFFSAGPTHTELRKEGEPMAEQDRRITVEEIQGAPRRTGRFWLDFAAAGAAIFISVISLVIGIRGEAIQRELLAANSWPFLEINEDHSAQGEDSISVRNDGVGPAKVVSFEVFYNGKPVDNAIDLLRRCCGLSAVHKDALQQTSHGIALGDVANNVIRADQGRTMLSLKRPPDKWSVFDQFDAQFTTLTFRACYCSILDRCWISDLRTLKPAEIGSCPVPAHPFGMINDVRP